MEDESGTFILSSKDLCMIQHIPELVHAGVTAWKIEGRMKSQYYVAAVTRIYREALDRVILPIPADTYTIKDGYLSLKG